MLLGMACVYMRIFDGDQGQIYRGMGPSLPPIGWPEGFAEEVQAKITAAMVAAMAKRGTPFKGVLFAGLMATKDGPKGNRIQRPLRRSRNSSVMPLLEDDLLPWLRASRDGTLSKRSASGPKRKALHGVHLVMADAGYHGTPRKGDPIHVPMSFCRPPAMASASRSFSSRAWARESSSFVTNGGACWASPRWPKAAKKRAQSLRYLRSDSI